MTECPVLSKKYMHFRRGCDIVVEGYYNMSRSKVIINPDVIIDEAFDLIRTRGLDSLSVRKLASRLNVSSMTLYNYVANMEEIKGQVIGRALEDLRRDIARMVDGLLPDSKRFFMRMGMAVYRFARANTQLYKLMMYSAHSELYFEPEDLAVPFGTDVDKKAFYLLQTIIHGLLSKDLLADLIGDEAEFTSYLHLALDRLFPDLR